MSGEINKIDNLFSEYLGEYSENPPLYVWSNVRNSMNEKRKKRRVIFYWSVAASIAVILSFTFGYRISTEIVDSKSVASSDVSSKLNSSIPITQNQNLRKSSENAHSETISSTTNGLLKAINSSTAMVQKAISDSTANKNSINLDTLNTNLLIASKTGTFNSIGNKQAIIAKLEYLSPIQIQVGDFKGKDAYLSPLSEKQLLAKLGVLPELASDIEPAKMKKVRVTGSFAPVWAVNSSPINDQKMYASSSVLASNSNSATNYANKEIEDLPQRTYAGGFAIGYRFNKKFGFKTGVSISEKSLLTKNIPIIANKSSYSFNVSKNNINADNINVVANDLNSSTKVQEINAVFSNTFVGYSQLEQKFNYIELPFIFNYDVIQRLFSLTLESGINTGFLIKNLAELDQSGKNIWTGKTNKMKSNIFTAVVGFDIGYQISPRIACSIGPQFKYSLNSVNSDGNFYNYPISTAIYTGITYSF